MMLLPRVLPFVVLVSAMLGGCSSTRTESYSVLLHNGGNEPVTAWLTKSGGPVEDGWLAPEQIDSSRPISLADLSGATIPPGRTGDIGPIKGAFDAESVAILRVYAGKLSFDQMLATPSDGSLRVDVPLTPGTNRLEVKPGAKLRVEPSGRGDAATQP